MNDELNLDVTEQIKNEIKSNDVVLFMKGTPVFPMCGFSAATSQILAEIGVKFKSVNVLDSNEIREGIITRNEALKLVKEDNKPRYETLKNFSEIIGFNLDVVLSKISSIDKLY